jgi:putative spermidine/putrescine transport system ATP-binding protein
MTDGVEISVQGIGKTYGGVAALRDVSLDIVRGEFLTLLGPSGSGKTTLLMILAGFTAPTSGRLLAGGVDITARPAEQRACGMVFQGYALFPHMSVAANLAFPLRVRGRPAAEIKRRVAAMIERVGLSGHERKRPAQLSGGQQQRVALGRALIFEPSVLLLDEPFSALDKNLREQMQVEVRRLHDESGTTFVFVTHDQTEALALSSRIAIFDHGRLLQLGNARDVYERPANRFVAEFLGDINLLPAPGGLLAIRPEHMACAMTPPGDGGPAVAAVVERRIYQGAATRLHLRTQSGTPLTLSAASHTVAAAPGDAVWVTWPAERGFVLPAGT